MSTDSVPPATPREREAPTSPWAGPLTPWQLLVVALLSRGYTLSQIRDLLGTPARQVIEGANAAAARLGVANWNAAVREARRRRLID